MSPPRRVIPSDEAYCFFLGLWPATFALMLAAMPARQHPTLWQVVMGPVFLAGILAIPCLYAMVMFLVGLVAQDWLVGRPVVGWLRGRAFVAGATYLASLVAFVPPWLDSFPKMEHGLPPGEALLGAIVYALFAPAAFAVFARWLYWPLRGRRSCPSAPTSSTSSPS